MAHAADMTNVELASEWKKLINEITTETRKDRAFLESDRCRFLVYRMDAIFAEQTLRWKDSTAAVINLFGFLS
jgi:hypothetical protein